MSVTAGDEAAARAGVSRPQPRVATSSRQRLRSPAGLILALLLIACRDPVGPDEVGRRLLADQQWGWVPGSSSLIGLTADEGPIHVVDVVTGASRVVVPASGGAWSYNLGALRIRVASGFVFFSGWARATQTSWLLRAPLSGAAAPDTLARMALFQYVLNDLPTPSPDGRFVAWSSVTGPTSFLATLDLRTGERRQYAAPMLGDCPAFSPDGGGLVGASSQPGPASAWWVDLTTSAVRTVALGNGVDLCAGDNVAWEGGAPVLFSLLGTTLTRYQLRDGASSVVGQPPVATGYTAYPAVRVDAANHAVTWWEHLCTKEHSSFLGTSCVRTRHTLYLFDWSTGASRELLRFEMAGAQYDADPLGQAVISPDGQWVAYRCYRCPSAGVYLARLH